MPLFPPLPPQLAGARPEPDDPRDIVPDQMSGLHGAAVRAVLAAHAAVQAWGVAEGSDEVVRLTTAATREIKALDSGYAERLWRRGGRVLGRARANQAGLRVAALGVGGGAVAEASAAAGIAVASLWSGERGESAREDSARRALGVATATGMTPEAAECTFQVLDQQALEAWMRGEGAQNGLIILDQEALDALGGAQGLHLGAMAARCRGTATVVHFGASCTPARFQDYQTAFQLGGWQGATQGDRQRGFAGTFQLGRAPRARPTPQSGAQRRRRDRERAAGVQAEELAAVLRGLPGQTRIWANGRPAREEAGPDSDNAEGMSAAEAAEAGYDLVAGSEEQERRGRADGPWYREVCGRLRKFNPEEWARAGTTGQVLRDVDRVDFALVQEPRAIYDQPNLASAMGEHRGVVADLIAEYQRDGKIEWQDEVHPGADGKVPIPAFAHCILPWGSTTKAGSDKRRPYLHASCAGGGPNAAMGGWSTRMPSPEHALQVLRAGQFLGKRDWCAGFHHCILADGSRRLMAFRHPGTGPGCPSEGRVGRFVSMPFGGSQCPGRFTDIAFELLRIARAELERAGLGSVTLVGFVDDVLLAADSHEDLVAAFTVLDNLGDRLGVEWAPHKDEGREQPVQQIIFCGMGLDTRDEPLLTVAADKVARYQATVSAALVEAGNGCVTQGTLQTIVGQLAFLARACRWGRGHLRGLYTALQRAGDGPYDHRPRVRVRLSAAALADLEWWHRLLGDAESPWRGRTKWATASWNMVKGTHFFEQGGDASGEGGAHGGGAWGASWGYERAAGSFDGWEAEQHICFKELITILYGLRLWEREYVGARVVVWTDNVAAAAAINSGTCRGDAMMRVVDEIADIAIATEIDIRARHIKGSLNIVNDDLSRGKRKASSADYKFVEYDKHCRPRASCDLYAQYHNVQLLEGDDTFFCTAANPAAEHFDACVGRRSWANPPFDLCGEAFEGLTQAWREDPFATSAVVVVPEWPTRWWYDRFIAKKDTPWKIRHRYPPHTKGVFYRSSARPDAGGQFPVSGTAQNWAVLVVELPAASRPRC